MASNASLIISTNKKDYVRLRTTRLRCLAALLVVGLELFGIARATAATAICKRTISAHVVAIDQPIMFNRLGAQNINGMIFALSRDVVTDSATPTPIPKSLNSTQAKQLAGHVFLRPDKRPRPLVLRVAATDCLEVHLTNLLTPVANPRDSALFRPNGIIPPTATVGGTAVPNFGCDNTTNPICQTTTNSSLYADDQLSERAVGFHAQGMQVLNTIRDDGSFVGRNPLPNGLIEPGESIIYRLFAEQEGTFLISSHGATFGGDGASGNSTNGLFGAINVEPYGARIYRSQVTDEEMRLAAATGANHVGGAGQARVTTTGQPLIDYEALYPATNPDGSPSIWVAEGKAGLPVLNMLRESGSSPRPCGPNSVSCEIVHSDINAVIAGPDPDGTWLSKCPGPMPQCPFPLESKGRQNPSLPNRWEPFREFTVVFHDEMAKKNAFEHFYDRSPAAANPLGHTLQAVGDVFMVNYGSGGIGSEIIANRLGVGPMHDCLGCNAEEFFLTSHAVGDPSMVVDIPANFGLENCKPIAHEDGSPTGFENCGATGPKATRAYYPDDPSNVHHSYISDHVRFRNVHTGKEHHIFHLHNHQWLYNPNDDNSNYLDAQAIGPGSGYTYEINFGGSGNRNKSAGDAIFHCHLYPHFAQGMWELWRNHDVFESGTPLQVSGNATGFHNKPFALQDGLPMTETISVDGQTIAASKRALPDGEILAGTPIPALVPLPSKAMAPMPGRVHVIPTANRKVDKKDPLTLASVGMVAAASVAKVDRTDTDPGLVDNTPTPLGNPINPRGLKNPGFPFWIGGIENSVGQRPPTPPLDMMPDPKGQYENGGWDGGLPRHALDGLSMAKAAAGAEPAFVHNETRFDLSKAVKVAKPIWFPEDGTELEKAAMAFHAKRDHPSTSIDLAGHQSPAEFITNGSGRPVAGAPFHEPCIDDRGKVLGNGVTGAFFSGLRDGFEVEGKSPFNADTPRVYKGADIQFDVVLNKAGWHYPQERIIALWEDAKPIIAKGKAPEPLVMRNNTFDCTMFLHTNLVPKLFEMDDFEVRTSTDIIGQHIHLPKWDLSTTDGSGNGWNYEDGTIAPDEVQDRIKAINSYNGAQPPETKDVEGHPVYTSENLLAKATPIGASLTSKPHPYFGKAENQVGQNWLGARTTLQRWFFDPVVNTDSIHRGLGIIFTHDHFGPSTHQQVGLYATVLVEPPGASWIHNETGVQLGDRSKVGDGGRNDGGPTSWQAVVSTQHDKREYAVNSPANLATGDLDGDGENDSYREFFLEYSDFQHAYLPGKYVGASQSGVPSYVSADRQEPEEDGAGHYKPPPQSTDKASYLFAVNPPVKDQANDMKDLVVYKNECPLGFARPCPEAITADDPGTMVVNYRNEPVGLRILDSKTGEQAQGKAGDLAYALKTFKKPWGFKSPKSGGFFDWFKKNKPDEDRIGKDEENVRAYRVANATFGSRDDANSTLRGVLNDQPREGDSINGTCFPRVLQAKCWNPLVGAIPGLPKCDDAAAEDTSDEECTQRDRDSSAKSVAKPGDPFTPIIRAYYGDRVRLKVQAGGDEETHNVTLHGLKWLQGGSGFGFDPNSGWRNSQQAGISEQFTFAAPILPLLNRTDKARFDDLDIRSIIKEFDPEFESLLSERLDRLNVGEVLRKSGKEGGLLSEFKKGRERLEGHFDNIRKRRSHLNLDDIASIEDDPEKEWKLDEFDVQLHQKTDHLYSVDASTEGYWNGTWGLIRTYDKGVARRGDLVYLPNNKRSDLGKPDFDSATKDVCPTDADDNPIVNRHFDISAVLANDVLGNHLGVDSQGNPIKATIPSAPALWSGSLNQSGGTLVYNPRSTDIRDVTIPADAADQTPAIHIEGHASGVLHDPTAILYVHTRDLVLKDAAHSSSNCLQNGKLDPAKLGNGCGGEELTLRPDAPVEPLVLRARAGECIEVTLRNLIGKKGAADVWTYRQLAPVIPRFPDHPDGTVLNANRVRTTSVVGLHPALVAYDVTTNDGTAVGINDNRKTLADNSNQNVIKYRWYAGDISLTPDRGKGYGFVRTPIELGGINLMPADKMKQGQKGLVGSLVIEPAGSTWNEEACDRDPNLACASLEQMMDHQQVSDRNNTPKHRDTRLMATVTPSEHGLPFRDFVTVVQKGLTQLYGDGKPVEGIAAVDPFDAETGAGIVEGEAVTEDTEDAGGVAINYGSEPLWFRFGLPPSLPLSGKNPSFRDFAGIANHQGQVVDHQHREAYANSLAGGDPVVPVLTAKAGQPFRMHVLEPAGTARGSVYNLHGHVWQRAPDVCAESSYHGLVNVCPKTGFFPTLPGFEVGSTDIGVNPLSMYLGGQDSILPAAHFDIVEPSAGGENQVPGDYLYKDQAGFGNLAGMWGILRVEEKRR